MRHRMRGQTVIVSAMVLLSVYIAGLFLVWRGNASIAKENALMENLQAASLTIACLCLLPCLMRSVTGFSRFASWSLLLALVSMLLREVDVETLPLPAPFALIGSGTGRDLLLGSAFVGTFGVLIRRRYELAGPLIQFVLSRSGILLGIGCSLYVASLPFDKNLLGLSTSLNQFCEEAVECGATLMFLTATLVILAQFTTAVRSKSIETPTAIPTTRMAA